MIRTLLLIAVVSFVLAIACFAGSFAIAGGPFILEDGWRIHHLHWDDGDEDERPTPPKPPAPPSPPPTPENPS